MSHAAVKTAERFDWNAIANNPPEILEQVSREVHNTASRFNPPQFGTPQWGQPPQQPLGQWGQRGSAVAADEAGDGAAPPVDAAGAASRDDDAVRRDVVPRLLDKVGAPAGDRLRANGDDHRDLSVPVSSHALSGLQLVGVDSHALRAAVHRDQERVHRDESDSARAVSRDAPLPVYAAVTRAEIDAQASFSLCALSRIALLRVHYRHRLHGNRGGELSAAV